MNTHWRRLALKRLCRVSAAYGANLSSDAYQPDGVRFVRTTDILDSGELSGGGVYVDDNMVRDYRLQDGDLLLSRSGTVANPFSTIGRNTDPVAMLPIWSASRRVRRSTPGSPTTTSSRGSSLSG